MAGLEKALVETILQRMGMANIPTRDLTGLGEIYAAWCRHVPFDNCRKLIACRAASAEPLPGDDPLDFFESWIAHGVGGTCWSVHGAWYELLSALGFKARRVVSTMMAAPNLPPNHGSVIVDIAEQAYLVDVAIKYMVPLQIVPGQETCIEHPAWGVRGHWLDDKYAVRWLALHVSDALIVVSTNGRWMHKDSRHSMKRRVHGARLILS